MKNFKIYSESNSQISVIFFGSESLEMDPLFLKLDCKVMLLHTRYSILPFRELKRVILSSNTMRMRSNFDPVVSNVAATFFRIWRDWCGLSLFTLYICAVATGWALNKKCIAISLPSNYSREKTLTRDNFAMYLLR